MATYIISVPVEGRETYFVEADSEQDALEKHNEGLSDHDATEVSAADAPEVTERLS